VLTTQLFQWLSWLLAIKERKKEGFLLLPNLVGGHRGPPKNREIALNGSISDILALAGSASTITEITKFKVISLLKDNP